METCPQCQATFEPRRDWQRYCSLSCQQTYNRNLSRTLLKAARAAYQQQRIEEIAEFNKMIDSMVKPQSDEAQPSSTRLNAFLKRLEEEK